MLLETIGRRWYAFGFIVVFLWAASAERGWRRALRFLAVAGLVSFVAEYVSTRTGWPYGYYEYVARTRGDELYLSNVPLFVPVSFGVVVWAGRAIATAGWRARGSTQIVAGGALAAAAIDLVIDPMTLRGGDWFLGPLYSFRAGPAGGNGPAYEGGWFDVPWSNTLGWIVVAAIILAVDELLDAHRPRAVEPVRGVTLAAIIVGFFLVIAVATGHFLIALAGSGVTAVLALVSFRGVRALVAEGDRPPEPEPAA